MLLASLAHTGAAAAIVAAAAGKRIRVWKIQATMGGAGVFQVHAGTAAADTRLVYGTGVAGTSVVVDYVREGGWVLPANTALNATTSAETMHVVVYYTVGDA